MFSKLINFIDDCLWRYHFRKDLQKRWQNFWAAKNGEKKDD